MQGQDIMVGDVCQALHLASALGEIQNHSHALRAPGEGQGQIHVVPTIIPFLNHYAVLETAAFQCPHNLAESTEYFLKPCFASTFSTGDLLENLIP